MNLCVEKKVLDFEGIRYCSVLRTKVITDNQNIQQVTHFKYNGCVRSCELKIREKLQDSKQYVVQ